MLLGIVLHASLSYTGGAWAVRDGTPSQALGVVVAGIHGFRMPLFFLVSGFFTAMLLERLGMRGMLAHRARRIALPLALGLATIVPLMWISFALAGAIGGRSAEAGPDAARDIWSAAALGDRDELRGHLERGASPGRQDPVFGQTPLAWTAIVGQPEAARVLLAADADPSGRSRDGGTPLHAAAFFGRDEVARILIDGGADASARNREGRTPGECLDFDEATTREVARALDLPIDFATVARGRGAIRELLASRAADDSAAHERPTAAPPDRPLLRALGGILFGFPLFHHLWFLWYLCWLVAGFAVVRATARSLPSTRVPKALVATPLALAWLVPLTLLPQWFMHEGGRAVGFGPDTSAGLVPMPHILAYYAVFFGFGALLHSTAGRSERLARRWWIMLPLALVLFPIAFSLAHRAPWTLRLVSDDSARRLLAALGEVLFAWLMIFGAMGLFESLLPRERKWVRYLADASFWLYLAHLPLVIVGQAVMRRLELPMPVELLLLLAAVIAILLASYHWIVRPTWIGALLNGSRKGRGSPGE